MELMHPQCGGLDVHQHSVVACARVVTGSTITHDVRTFGTTTANLLALSDWLTAYGCTQVAVESTGVYWKPVWHVLEGSFALVLANAMHVRVAASQPYVNHHTNATASHFGADPKMFKGAKDMGLPAQNCQYCDASKIPKKETFKMDVLNDRGKWLVAEKDKRKSKDVKGEWLKEFPGGKEQK
jgi:transposase